MGRPSVAVERRRQIIDAALRSMAIHGFAGTTLDRIAEVAGMARGHVRHFAGNRDELLTEAAKSFYFDGTDGRSLFPENETLAAALDYLFGGFVGPDEENVIALGFVEAARVIPTIAVVVLSAYTGTQAALTELIAAQHPDSSREAAEQVAYGVLTIALGNVFLSDIEASTVRTQAGRAAAERLIASLVERP